MPAGTMLHDFHVDLMSYLRANLRDACNDRRFRREVKEELSEPLVAYLLREETADEPAPDEQHLPSDADLLELAEVTADTEGGPLRWAPTRLGRVLAEGDDRWWDE